MASGYAGLETRERDTRNFENYRLGTAANARNLNTMKCNVFFAIIAAVLSAILAYFTYTIAEGNENDVVCGMMSLLCFAPTLISAMALRTDSTPLNVNIKILAVVFFIVFLISNIAFAATTVVMPYYAIIHALLLTIFVAIMYKFFNNKDV